MVFVMKKRYGDFIWFYSEEVSAACLTSAQRTEILKFDGVIGIAVRIPIVLGTVAFIGILLVLLFR